MEQTREARYAHPPGRQTARRTGSLLCTGRISVENHLNSVQSESNRTQSTNLCSAQSLAPAQGHTAKDFLRKLKAKYVSSSQAQDDGAAKPEAFSWARMGEHVAKLFRPAPGLFCMVRRQLPVTVHLAWSASQNRSALRQRIRLDCSFISGHLGNNDRFGSGL